MLGNRLHEDATNVKWSYFIVEDEGKQQKLMIRFEEAKVKDIIVKVEGFTLPEDSDQLEFTYTVVHNPHPKEPKILGAVVRRAVYTIVNNAIATALAKPEEVLEEPNENRHSDPSEPAE